MCKKLIIALLLVTSMLLNVFATTNVFALNTSGGEVIIYVSPDGNDKNNGTIESPLKTFAGAKHRVRTVAGTKPVRVIFRAGQYNITQTQVFGKEDSGRPGAYVTYEGYPGENAVISGAIKLNVKDFKKVTNKDILMRMPVDARDNVIQLDLKKYGVDKLTTATELAESGASSGTGGKTMGYLLLENNEQMLAQWPNGDGGYDYMGKVYIKGSTSSFKVNMEGAACIGYTNERSNAWKNAVGNAYFQIYPHNDYRAELLALVDVDTIEKKLYISGGSQGFDETRNKARYKILNLLEELDVPTEYYIDRENMILYYYPPKIFNENSLLEITALQDNLLEFNGASFIKFNNLTVGNCSRHAFKADDKTHDLEISECILKNIAGAAVCCPSDYSTGNRFITKGVYNAVESGVYNINIDKNIIFNIGANAINLTTRNLTTFKNNIDITNNYLTKINTIAPGKYSICVYGYDFNISDNLIHTTNSGAMTTKGSESFILRNEVYDVCRQLSDCGGIYQGMQYAYMNTEIAYNLVYNVRGRFDMEFVEGYSGIYQDDCASGANIHHNMLRDIAKGLVLNGGKNHTYDNNVINVDGAPIGFHARGEDPVWNSYITRNTMDEHFMDAKEIPYLIKQYPVFAEVADGRLRQPYNDTVTNNIANGEFRGWGREKDYDRIAELGHFENNTTITDTNIYVDFEHADMRLKMGTEIQKKHPDALNEENFDINDIGIDWDPTKKIDKNFVRYYPVDDSIDVDNAEVTFFWSEAVTSDKYRIIVATDENFENVVIDDITYYNNYTTDALNSERTDYYWKVYAINERRYNETSWEASDGVGHFQTVLADGNDVESLARAIENAKIKAEQIVDGENYIEGTKQMALDAIAKANKVYKEEAYTASRSKVKSTIYELNFDLEKCADNLILKYVNTEDWFKSKDYYKEVYAGRNLTFEVKDDMLTYVTNEVKEPQNGFATAKMMERDAIFCFKTKMEYGSGWGGFAVRHLIPTVLGYSGGSYLIVVKDERIELQRSGGSGYLAVALNDGIIKDGEWHDMAFGAVNSMFGTRVIFIVDGVTVFDYVDGDTAIYDEGYFSVFTGSVGYNIYMKPADVVYEFTPPVKAKEVNVSGLNLSQTHGRYETSELEGNEIVNANITFNGESEFTVYDDGSKNYKISVDDSFVTLTENQGTESTVLSKVDNCYLRSGDHDVRLGAVRIKNSNRIILVADGKTVIDYYDFSPIDVGGRMTFKVSSVTEGLGVPHIIDLEAENEHDGVIEHARTKNDVVTDTYKKFVINSDFARSRYYFKRWISPDGDKEAKVKITFDQDIVQTGEEIYEEYTMDFTKGDDGWFCIGVGTHPEVIIEITSSGNGKLNVGDYAGFGTTDNATIELNNLQTKLTDLFVAKADRDILIGEDGTVKLPENVQSINKEYLFPIDAVSGMGGTVEINGESITITKGENVAKFTVGSNTYTVNEKTFEMSNAVSKSTDGNIMISIDAIAKALNKMVYKHPFGLVLIADDITNTYKLTVNETENVIKKFY